MGYKTNVFFLKYKTNEFKKCDAILQCFSFLIQSPLLLLNNNDAVVIVTVVVNIVVVIAVTSCPHHHLYCF